MILLPLMLLISANTNAEHHLNQHPDIADQLTSVIRLPLVHKDKLAISLSSSSSYRLRFKARRRRDARRLGRRLSGGVPDLRMDMQDGFGEYFVTLGVGSPPTDQTLVMDTGSDLVWIQCQGCNPCFQQPHPTFDPTKSHSLQWVSCDSGTCKNLEDRTYECSEDQCIYKYSYGDKSYTIGSLALETLTIGGTTIPNVVMGCGTENQLPEAADGLLGLGRGYLSLVSQSSGIIGAAFSFCLGDDGWLTFGRSGLPGEEAKWALLIPNFNYPTFYYIELLRLEVDGNPIDIPANMFQLDPNGKGGVIIDTGTTLTKLPEVAYNALRDNVKVYLDKLFTLDPQLDTCYSLGSGVVLENVQMPRISFIFRDMYNSTAIIQINATNILMMKDTANNIACFAFAKSEETYSIIGNMQLQGIQITIDASAGYVGFGPDIC